MPGAGSGGAGKGRGRAPREDPGASHGHGNVPLLPPLGRGAPQDLAPGGKGPAVAASGSRRKVLSALPNRGSGSQSVSTSNGFLLTEDERDKPQWTMFSRDPTKKAPRPKLPEVKRPDTAERERLREWRRQQKDRQRKLEETARRETEADHVRRLEAEDERRRRHKADILAQLEKNREERERLAREGAEREARFKHELKNMRAAKPLHERLAAEFEEKLREEEERKRRALEAAVARKQKWQPTLIFSEAAQAQARQQQQQGQGQRLGDGEASLPISALYERMEAPPRPSEPAARAPRKSAAAAKLAATAESRMEDVASGTRGSLGSTAEVASSATPLHATVYASPYRLPAEEREVVVPPRTVTVCDRACSPVVTESEGGGGGGGGGLPGLSPKALSYGTPSQTPVQKALDGGKDAQRRMEPSPSSSQQLAGAQEPASIGTDPGLVPQPEAAAEFEPQVHQEPEPELPSEQGLDMYPPSTDTAPTAAESDPIESEPVATEEFRPSFASVPVWREDSDGGAGLHVANRAERQSTRVELPDWAEDISASPVHEGSYAHDHMHGGPELELEAPGASAMLGGEVTALGGMGGPGFGEDGGAFGELLVN